MPLSIKCTYFKAKIHQFSPLQTLHRNITFPLLTRPPVGVSSGQHLYKEPPLFICIASEEKSSEAFRHL